MALLPWKKKELISWNPIEEMENIQGEMNKMFQSFLSHTGNNFPNSLWSHKAPDFNFYDRGKEYHLEADMPGMKKSDLSINIQRSINGDILEIHGERKHKENIKDAGLLKSGIKYGEYRASITLPARADSSKVKARYDHGVLEIDIPKSEAIKHKPVKVDID